MTDPNLPAEGERVTLTDYSIEIRLTVDSRNEEGDEAELLQEHVHTAMLGFSLAGCKVKTGLIERRGSLTMGADHPRLLGSQEAEPPCDRTTGHAGPCGAPDCWLLQAQEADHE